MTGYVTFLTLLVIGMLTLLFLTQRPLAREAGVADKTLALSLLYFDGLRWAIIALIVFPLFVIVSQIGIGQLPAAVLALGGFFGAYFGGVFILGRLSKAAPFRSLAEARLKVEAAALARRGYQRVGASGKSQADE